MGRGCGSMNIEIYLIRHYWMYDIANLHLKNQLANKTKEISGTRTD